MKMIIICKLGVTPWKPSVAGKVARCFEERRFV
ncbi:hypothetical protein STW0522RAO56_09770 [Raoultella planticola]|nr:hypothetical protein STW0522RAO56_09770 [Raoultella planticola]